MDNFRFDLQLFADIEIDLAGAGGKNVYAIIDGATGWYTTAEYETAAASAADPDSVAILAEARLDGSFAVTGTSDDKVSVIAGDNKIVVRSFAGQTLYISGDGGIHGLAPGISFDMEAPDTYGSKQYTFTVTDDGKWMNVTGDRMSVYELDSSALDRLELKIVKSTAPYVEGTPIIELKSTTEDSVVNKLEPLPLALKLEAASAQHGMRTFYLVDKTGKVSLCVDGSGKPVSDVSGLPGWNPEYETVTLPSDIIGYFTVDTSWDSMASNLGDPAPWITVTSAGKSEFLPAEFGADRGNVLGTAYSGRIVVDATAVATITKNGKPNQPLTSLMFQEVSYNPNGPIDTNVAYGVVDNSMISVVGLARTATTNALGSISYLFDWNGTHYFPVNASTKDGDPPLWSAVIGAEHELGQSEYSPFCLRVTSAQAANGVVTISGMRLVQNTAGYSMTNGVMDPVTPNYVEMQDAWALKRIYIDAGGTKGVTLSTHNVTGSAARPVVIRNVPNGGVFTGLNNTDAIVFADEGVAFTVNGRNCTFQDGKIVANSKTYIPAAGFGDSPTICIDGTILQGAFMLDSSNPTLTASAVPQNKEDTVTRDITYIGSGDVKVVVKMNGNRTGGEIDGVMGIDEGEKVVIKNYVGNTSTLNSTTTIEKKNGVVTKVFSGDGLPAPITLTSTTADENTNLLNWRTFEMKSAFDFGKTTVGSMGIFEADENGNLTIAAQPSTGVVLGPFGEQKKYVRALASKASGTYTINYLEVNVFNDANNPYSEYELDQLTHCVSSDMTLTIEAPTDGNLTLRKGAIDLKEYDKFDENGNWMGRVEEDPPSLQVTNAQAGKSYSGFTEKDTIAGTLGNGEKLTVNGAAFTSGADGVVIISGDGKAMFGSFFVGTAGIQSVHFVWDDVSFAVADVITKTIKGYKDAVVQFHDGEVIGITGLTAGKTVTIETKNENGVVTKRETYTAKAVAGSTALDIEYKVDGVTMSTYTVPDAGTNIAGVEAFTYTEDANVDTGKMTYQVTTNGDTVVVNVRDGEVIGISGMTSNEDGTQNGSVTVTDENGNEAKYTAWGVKFTTLNNDTTVTTAALKNKDSVWLGDAKYKIGADGALTVKKTNTGEVRFVDGTLRLWDGGKVPDCEKSFTAQAVDNDGNIIETQVDFSANGMPDPDTRNIVVTVKDGNVTGIKSFGAHKNGAGETVTITTTVTNPADPDNPTVRTETYQAEFVTGTSGKIKVTCTDDIGNAKSFVFADVNQNILDPSTKWAIANQVTEQDFDWDGVGYFRAAPDEKNPKLYTLGWEDRNDDTSAICTQNGGQIDGSNQGEIYLEVSGTKDAQDVVTVGTMRLVQVQANGTFAAYPPAKGTIGYYEIEAKNLNGVHLPSHTAATTVRIWTNRENSVFTGLNAGDFVEIPCVPSDPPEYGNYGIDGTITVNGKQFTVTNKNDNGAVIYGNGTLGRGDFLITDTATAAAVPWDGMEIAKTLTYTYDEKKAEGNGVWVTVHSDGDGGIGEVSGLDAGENVVITGNKGSKEDIRAVEDNGGVLVTRLSTHDGLNFLFTRRGDADTIRQTAVTRESGFTVENLFDYGATDDGKVGFFRANLTDPNHPVLTVVQQQESDKVTFGSEGELYVAVGATKNKTSGAVTITNMKIFAISKHGSLDEMPFFEVDKAKYPTVDFPDMPIPPIRNVEFVAPEGVDLTLKADAIKLNSGTVGDKDDNPVVVQKGPRVVAIHVTGAQAGKRYAGLSAIDTVSTNALAKGKTLIVNGVTFTAAADDAFTIRGDGKAVIDGTFAIKSGITSVGDGFTQTITGAANGVVRFQDGEVVGLSGLTNGQKVTVQRKNASNVVLRTETYTAKAVAGAFEITYTLTGTGLPNQTIKYTVPDSQTNITGVTVHEYTEDTTVDRGVDSYAVAMNGDEKIVVVEQNGKVIAISGMTSDEDGTHKGCVTVTDENGNVAEYTAAGVKFTTLNNGTTVKTAALKNKQTAQFGSKKYKAGADGVITAEVVATDEVRFVEGTLRLWDGGKVPECEKSLTTRTTDVDGNVIETQVDFDATGMPEDKSNIVVTVKDGKVTGITSFGAYMNVAGETVTITTTVNGVQQSTMTYHAAMENGKIRVTRTDDIGNAASYLFADVNQNILEPSTKWAITNQVTEQDFDWDGVGYFYAVKNGNVYTPEAVAKQDGNSTIDSGNVGDVYLEVVSTKDANGIATISSLRLVKVQANGTFAVVSGTIGPLEIEAVGLNGLKLPKHTSNVRIWAAQPGKFEGLNAKDAVWVRQPESENGYYQDDRFAGKIIVNGKEFEVTADTGVRILGNGEMDHGTFIIKGTETAAISDPESDDCNKKIVYEFDENVAEGNGVKIVVYPESGIESVTGLDVGEKVTLISTALGNSDVFEAVADGSQVLLKYTEKHNGFTVRYTMRGDEETIRQTDVTKEPGFMVENLFDYGATDDGKIGFFLADETGKVTVTQQHAGETVTFEAAKKKYVAVAATKDKRTGAVTITNVVSLEMSENGHLNDLSFNEIGAVNIVAPTGDFTLKSGAINLGKTPRTTAIHVTDAQAGKRYAGLSAIDTVSTNALAKGKTLIVNGVTFTAAADDAFTIRGDGKAVIDGFTRTVTGAASAVVQVKGGRVYGLTGLLNGQKVTVQTKFDDGGVQTETYMAKAVPGSTALDVTYTLTKTDKSVKTIAYTVPDSATNIAGVTVWEFTDDTAEPIVTEKDTFEVTTSGDTITVIEQNGVVKEISGLVNGSVTVTEENGNVAAYTAAGVVLTINAAGQNIKTVPLVAGQTVSAGGVSTYTVGANGAPVFYADTAASLQLVEGALQFTADGESVTTKAGDITSEVRYNANNVVGEAVGVVIAVSDGVVTSLKGLDRATDGEDGESVTVTTGENWVSYAAAYCTETGKEGWVKVTRTDSIGNESTCVFADNTLDVLDPGVKWTVTNLVTEQNFDGVGVGYFLVNADGTMEPAKPQREEPFDRIDKSDAGKVYLKVTSESMKVNDHDEVGVITGFGFVKVLENGTFAETVAPQNFQGITLDVDQAVGFALPPHTEKVAIINAKDENGFAGLNAGDTISGSEAGTVSIGKADKKGNFTATATFTVAEAGKYTVTGAGTIVEGVFTVTGKAVGSAVPKSLNDTASKEITYTAGTAADSKDGVVVTFVANSPYGEGEIESVRDLDEGEKVVINHYEYTAKGVKQYETTTIEKKNGVVTKTMKNSAWPVAVVMMNDSADEDTDVFGQRGYKMASTFDFSNSKTTAAVGLFEIKDSMIINGDQTEVPEAFCDVDKNYIMIGATKKNGTYTTSYFEVLHYDYAKNQLGTVSGDGLLDGGVTIAAPQDGNLALSADISGMPRTYSFNVTGAQAGKSYSGFKAQDTICATLTKGKAVTVNGKAFMAGVDNDVTIRGDGKATGGVFTVGTGFETSGGEKITATKTTAAVATVVNGKVTSLTGLAAGQSVTITRTEDTGAVTTTVYSAAAIRNDSAHLLVTKTETVDNVTTTATATVGKTGELTGETYTDTGASVANRFDWTLKNGSGYFEATLTGGRRVAADIGPTTRKITKDDAGKYFLQVSLSADGVLTGGEVDLWCVGADGLLVRANLLLSKLQGTMNITAPTALPLIFDRSRVTNFPKDGMILAIFDAANGSVLSELKNKDVVLTDRLAEGESITVNGAAFTMGAADLFRVIIKGSEANLADGTLMFTGNTTVKMVNESSESTGQFAVTGGAVVKVLNGEVVAISGLTNGNVMVTDGKGNVATYSATGVDYTSVQTGDIKTAALAKGQTISIDGKTYIAGANGPVTFTNEGGTTKLVDGVLLLEANSSVALSRSSVTTGENNTGNILVTVRNGFVTSITGMKKGDSITVNMGTYTDTYNAVSNTIVTKNGVKAYLTEAGGDVVGASYLEEFAAPPEGQFSWASVSGRSTGYFAVSGNKATVAEQAAKSAINVAKGTVAKPNVATYVVANTVQPDGSKIQVLTIDAVKVTNDGTGTVISETGKAALLKDVTVTVTAPAAVAGSNINPHIKYTKGANDTFHIILNKVAGGSRIIGLEDGDRFTTNTMEIGKRIYLCEQNDNPQIIYEAGAKGTLEFQGEGDKSDTSNRTTLLNGTIRLTSGVTAATLSGSKGDKDDDITVTVNGLRGADPTAEPPVKAEEVFVAVKSGAVNSITGLQTKDATVTLEQNGATVTYQVLYSEPVYNAKGEITSHTTMVMRTEITAEGKTYTTYGTFTDLKNVYATSSVKTVSGKEVYSVTNGFAQVPATATPIPTNTDVLFTESEVVRGKAQPRTVYVAANYNEEKNTYSGRFALAEAVEINPADLTKRGNYYLAATVTTVNGVTTISKVEVVQVNALGVPTVVKNAQVGRVTIDGKIAEGSFAKINFTIPKKVAVTATNVALGSVFTGVEEGEGFGDKISTAQTGTFEFGVDGTSVTVYKPAEQEGHIKEGYMETRTYSSKTKGIKVVRVATEAGIKTRIQDFTSGSLSVVEMTEDRGRIQTDYVYDKNGVLTKTFIAENGAKKVFRRVTEGGTVEERTGFMFETQPTIDLVVSDFNWTMDKNKVGYALVSNGKATVKTATTTIRKGDTKKYIEVALVTDGTIESIKQTVFNANAAALNGMKKTDEKFTGTITITAPTKALTFDRSKVDADTIADTAKVAVTGAAAGSKITKLVLGDTVATAKLAAAQTVIVGNGTNGTFTAGAAGALSFLVQKVNGADALTVTGGTIALDAASEGGLGGKYAYIGTKLVTITKGDLTVTVTGSGKAYTIGSMKEGEKFIVEDFATGTVREYERSATALFCTTTAAGQTTTSVYNIGAGVSLASGVLESTKGWTVYTDANKTFSSDNTLVSGKAVTVDLAAVDKRVTADKAPGTEGYEFVIDTYMATPTKFAGAASVIDHDNSLGGLQTVIGTSDADHVYKAKDYKTEEDGEAPDIAQTIKAADKWTVYGSDQADTIIGAAKGTSSIIGGAGNDTITAGGAEENFTFKFDGTNGQDTLKGYATGKDKITIEGEFNDSPGAGSNLFRNTLMNNGNVRLWKDNNGNGSFDDGEDSVELVGMGNGKAVTINGKNYYFGNGKAAKAETFVYAEGGFYRAKKGLANVLQVGTDNTKATSKTLGDTVSIDLNAVTNKGIGYYKNIAVVDASKSGNELVLTASDEGSTLKGGTYRSTLKAGAGQDSLVGGSGEDVFWFDTVEKNDVVTGYTSGKDSLYLGDFDAERDTAVKVNGLTVEVNGADVVFSNGDLGSVTLKNGVNTAKPITICADKEGTATVDYYVGKTGTYDKKGNLVKASNTFTAVRYNTNFEKASYYVGSDTANDTLKVVSADTKSKLTTKVSLADFEENGYAYSIDVLDVSGMTTVKDSEITIEGKKEGTFTLIGSSNKAVKETFDLKNLTVGDNKVVITNFSVDDVIELAAGMELTQTSADNAANTVYSLKLEGADYGTLTINGVKAANIDYDNGNLTDTRKTKS